MPRTFAKSGAVLVLSMGLLSSRVSAVRAEADFGLMVEKLLNNLSASLFGVQEPLPDSALGPFQDSDTCQALQVAKGLSVEVVSNVTDPLADQIALWPDDVHPTHLFVCVENSFDGDNNPDAVSVQRVDLSGNPDSNVETIVKGCLPVILSAAHRGERSSSLRKPARPAASMRFLTRSHSPVRTP
jgi:hypothetical protein